MMGDPRLLGTVSSVQLVACTHLPSLMASSTLGLC